MEDQSDIESEEISQSFVCCVCLDLIYKPIVLSCGHISCFWCVQKSMNMLRESHCPVCRHTYNHFPTICQMLHFLLMKMYPVAYKRREDQVLEEEKKNDLFSPQFDHHACGSQIDREFDRLGNSTHSSTTNLESNSCSDPQSTMKGEPWANKEQLESNSLIQDCGTTTSKETCDGNSEVIRTVAIEDKNFAENKVNGKHNQVSIADLLCAACKQLLIRPVVLNCGHVYCETCILNPADELLRCHVCQSSHPRVFPKVCLELDHFLEEKFPQEYALRRDTVQLKQVHFKRESTTTCSTEAGRQGSPLSSMPTGDHLPWWANPYVHRAGCDSCGMMPIIGDRYKCKDCVEAIGFDLCGGCYNSRSKLPGRFNQQHTPEHKFELIKFCNRTLSLVYGEHGSTALVISDDALEYSENWSPPSTLSSGSQDNTSNGLTAATHTDSLEDQNDTQSTN